MDSVSPSPIQETDGPKAEFRKLTNEAGHRKYRRRSPMEISSDEDGSPKRDHGSRGNSKMSDYERRNNDRMDDRRSSRSQHSDPDRHSARGGRHDERSKYVKHADEDDRIRAKSYSRSGQESRGGTYSDSRDRESDRSWDRYRNADRYSRNRSDVGARKYKDSSSDRTGYDGRHESRYDDRDRYAGDRDRDLRDEKRDYRSSRDHRKISREDSVGHHSLSKSKWETGDVRDVDGSKYFQEANHKTDRLKNDEVRHGRDEGKDEHKSGLVEEDFAAKRLKLLSSEDNETRKGDETSDSSHTFGFNGSDSAANMDAAKVAAIKAAELVNKNLSGTGFMTADQKKKLLWGSKKSTTTTEESTHTWNSAMFSDRERQEKFNKLMGVKGEVKVKSNSPSGQDAEKLQLDLEKQYTAGLRRRDGRTVGLGL